MHPDRSELSAFGVRPTRVRWLIFVLICAASWLLYLHRYSWGVIKPFIRQEYPGITDTELGWLDSAFLATYAVGQTPGGLAGDLLGTRAILILIILLWSLAVVAVGWTKGLVPLLGIRSAFGLTQAGAYPVVNKITGNWFPPAVRTSVQGVVTACGRVGAACAPILLATLLIGGWGLSWRMALVVIALPGVLLALAFWALFRNSPREHPWTNLAEQDVIAAGTASNESGNRVSFRLGGPAGVSLVVLLGFSFFSTFADMLYVNWIPSFLVEGKIEGKKLSTREMGWFAPLPLLGGAVGGVVGGMLNDLLLRRNRHRRWSRSGVALIGKALAAVLIVTSLAVPDGRWVMVLLLACKFFGDWSLPTLWGTITDMAGKGAGTVFGVVNTVGSIGGFVAGPVLGYLKQVYGWEGLFLGVGAAYLISALAWLFIDCTRRLEGADRET
jgi:ACS family glucarate transporter-like MFS transporter